MGNLVETKRTIQWGMNTNDAKEKGAHAKHHMCASWPTVDPGSDPANWIAPTDLKRTGELHRRRGLDHYPKIVPDNTQALRRWTSWAIGSEQTNVEDRTELDTKYEDFATTRPRGV